ncbi:MAG: RagB/SusD family nutrient uptake outer membrane protein [Bacteroidota bacterium]
MRSISKYIVVLFAGLILSACGEDFLNVTNPNALSADSFWGTPGELQQGLVGAYAALQLNGLLGGNSTVEHPVRSDIGRPNNWNANARSLSTLEFNPNTQIVQNRWRDSYIGVYRANQVLANLPNVEMDEELSTQIEAEARFLRGFFYYSLYRGYNGGSVIIHTTPPLSRDDFYKQPSPAEEVYNLILSDFEFAEANLPETVADDQLGRATWGAAAAMLGKLHINEGNYTEGMAYFKAILESGLYRLTADIGDNFDEAHEFNSESIFEVPFSIEAKPGTGGSAQDGPTGSEATSRARTLAPAASSGGFRVVMPSYWMTMLFRSDTMDRSNPINADRTGDANYSIRASVSIAIADDDNTTLYMEPSDEGGQYNNGEAAYVKKFQNWEMDREDPMSISGINERVIRLADVMLLYAECLLQTGGSYTEALDLVNQIRNRAGVPLLAEGDYNSTTLMEHIMWVERPLELMFEGFDMRWEDLTRWGKVKEQYQRIAQNQYVQVAKVLYFYDPAIHTQVPKPDDKVEAAELYNPDLHDYFPIPANETTSNPDVLGE